MDIVKMLPYDILSLISEYANFIPVNKGLYKHKLDNYVYRLKKKYSLEYYEKKIKIDCKFICLNLSGCQNITAVSALGNIINLNLSYCENITSVSALGNVEILNLSCCPNITDVSALGNVKELDLSQCQHITDVSALGNVIEYLDLSFCVNITDVSALGKVKRIKFIRLLSYYRCICFEKC